MNLDLMAFIIETTCLKNKGWGIRNKTLDWIALSYNSSEIVYFDSFGAEHVPEEIKGFIGNKNIIANICLVQANNSIMRE